MKAKDWDVLPIKINECRRKLCAVDDNVSVLFVCDRFQMYPFVLWFVVHEGRDVEVHD